MDDFYFYSTIVAMVILIGILTMIGITISKGNASKTYPPVQNECPDYWEQGTTTNTEPTIKGKTDSTGAPIPDANVSNYCKYGTKNIGDSDFSTSLPSDYATFTATKSTNDEWNTIYGNIGGNVFTNDGTKAHYYIQFQNNDASWNKLYPGLSVRCAKRKWANDRGILWDGVTNFNGCEPKVN
jgi:hypothetical protein